jgi:pimeloyl-ACP methyl ester carboxylesterase
MRNFLLCLLLTGLPAWAHAEIVNLDMRPGIGASAEYLPGRQDKPAILLLHGFLQTREFPTVATLAKGLRDASYPVLSPTLSLGIPHRRQSLACEAVHRHTLDEDVAEIARWVDWLKSRGHHSIVLVGHSFGSLELLAYLSGQPDRAVKGYVGASLIEVQIGPTPRSELIARLENRANDGRPALVTQNLSFCKRYTSTPQGLLSYVRWDQGRTLAALRDVRVETEVIVGAEDNLLARNWIRALNSIRTPVSIVAGANHFLDGEHEFDLLERTLAFLDRLSKDAPR